MSYVLVSLLGDGATELTDAFAKMFAVRYPPAVAFHEQHPDHDEVAAAIHDTPAALVFGHDGGGSLRGASNGRRWTNPEEFAQIFQDARVWTFACDTRSPRLEEDLDSFGRLASENGVVVFAGHCAPIPAVPAFHAFPELRNNVHNALDRVFRAFLEGENNAGELRRIALANSGRGRSLLRAANPIEEIMRSLRVRVLQ